MTPEPTVPSRPHEPVVFQTLCRYGRHDRLKRCWHIVENHCDTYMHHTTRAAAEETLRVRKERGWA